MKLRIRAWGGPEGMFPGEKSRAAPAAEAPGDDVAAQSRLSAKAGRRVLGPGGQLASWRCPHPVVGL